MATLQQTPQLQISDHHHPPKENKPKKQNDAAEKRVTVMVACMVGAFMAAWTPYSILAIFETFIGNAGQHQQQTSNISSAFTIGIGGHQQTRHEANRQMDDEKSNEAENFFYYVGAISPAFATIPSLFAKTSAVLNPLIYGLLNTQVTIFNLLNQFIFNNWKVNNLLGYPVPIGLGEIFDAVSESRSTPSSTSMQQSGTGDDDTRQQTKEEKTTASIPELRS